MISKTAKLNKCRRRGMTLTEIIATIAVLGLLATLIIPRFAGADASAETAACHAYRSDIEVQAEIWKHETGNWPASDLSDVGSNVAYFPSGVPTCPVDGSAYTLDSNGRVVGHDHE